MGGQASTRDYCSRAAGMRARRAARARRPSTRGRLLAVERGGARECARARLLSRARARARARSLRDVRGRARRRCSDSATEQSYLRRRESAIVDAAADAEGMRGRAVRGGAAEPAARAANGAENRGSEIFF